VAADLERNTTQPVNHTTHLEQRVMKTTISTIALTLTFLFILSTLQPTFAYSSAQVSNIQFNYPKYLNGVYITEGTVVIVSATIYNGGSQVSTFTVCPSQQVRFNSGGYGDFQNFACTSITLGTICSSTSGVVTMPADVHASNSGELMIRISVYATTNSPNTPLAVSPWYPVTYITP